MLLTQDMVILVVLRKTQRMPHDVDLESQTNHQHGNLSGGLCESGAADRYFVVACFGPFGDGSCQRVYRPENVKATKFSLSTSHLVLLSAS